MKRVYTYVSLALLMAFLPLLGGCASVRDQIALALDQAGVGGGQPPGDPYEALPWWENEQSQAQTEPVQGELGHIRGRLEGAVYFNDFADIIFAPPLGWINTMSDQADFEQSGVDIVSTGPEDMETATPSTSFITIMLSYAGQTVSEEDYWALRLSQLQTQGFGGAAFGTAELGMFDYMVADIPTPAAHTRHYIRRVDGYSVTIVLEADTPAAVDELVVSFA